MQGFDRCLCSISLARGIAASALITGLCASGAARAQVQSTANPPQSPEAAQTTQGGTATTSGTPTTNGTQDIVVTAQFRSQRLQDTPIAITAVSGALAEARSQMSLTDLGRTAPSVIIQTSTPTYGNTAAIYIRGVGQFDRDFGTDPGVGVYIDDVYYGTVYGAQLDLTDLDRVEMLRGPQGTLAGKNSIGGAIKLYSKRPTGSGDGYVQGTYGSFQRHDFRASVDVPVVKDVLAVRLAGVFKKRDGYIHRIDFACRHPGSGVPSVALSGDCGLGTEGGQDYKSARADIRWTPNPKLEINLIGEMYSDHGDPPGTHLVAVNPASANYALLTPFLDSGKFESYSTYQSQRGYGYGGGTSLRGHRASAQIEYKLGDDFKLTSITGQLGYKGFFETDLDGTSYGLITQHFNLNYRQFSQEVRLNGSVFDGLADFTAGGYYFKSHGIGGGRNEITPVAVKPPGTPGTPSLYTLQDDDYHSKDKSAFLHTALHPLTGLNLTLGVRYTDLEKRITFHRRDAVTFANQPLEGVTGGFKGDHVDYRASIDYRWSPEFLTYASFSTGFRSGGVATRPFRAEQVVPFGPESVKAYEAGVKADLFDRVLRLNADAYLTKYNNIQIIITSGTGIFAAPASIQVNAGKADIKGIELEGEVHPFRGFSIDGSFSYLDFEYKQLSASAIASRIQYSYVTPFTPKYKWSVGAQYEFPLGTDLTLTPRIDASYQSSQYTNAINTATALTAGYTLTNFRLALNDQRRGWELALGVTNLFDKYYYAATYDNQYTSTGIEIVNIGRPREWSITAKYKF